MFTSFDIGINGRIYVTSKLSSECFMFELNTTIGGDRWLEAKFDYYMKPPEYVIWSKIQNRFTVYTNYIYQSLLQIH